MPWLSQWNVLYVRPLAVHLYRVEYSLETEENVGVALDRDFEGYSRGKLQAHTSFDFVSFWNDNATRDEFRKLSQVARHLLATCSSETACERMFSKQGHIHSKLRNRLSDVHVEEEVMIATLDMWKRGRDGAERKRASPAGGVGVQHAFNTAQVGRIACGELLWLIEISTRAMRFFDVDGEASKGKLRVHYTRATTSCSTTANATTEAKEKNNVVRRISRRPPTGIFVGSSAQTEQFWGLLDPEWPAVWRITPAVSPSPKRKQ